MIILYHNNSEVKEIIFNSTTDFKSYYNQSIIVVLIALAKQFPDEIVVWCYENAKDNLNIEAIETLFHHKKLLFSYHPFEITYLDKRIGYVEDSSFIKINKDKRYPTWQMTSYVGAINTTTLVACSNVVDVSDNFDYFLNSLAKRAMQFGMFCYSEPKLILKNNPIKSKNKSSISELFKFTKQHYKTRWVFLLFFNILIYEKKIKFLPFVKSLFYKKRGFNPELLDKITVQSSKKIIDVGSIDVLIPSIGRKKYLLDVLENLSNQTYLPSNVIIVEQNPIENSISELDFIKGRSWPFIIKHHFTHQAGACNARNIGLKLIESEFVFMADDDIVFENDMIEKAFEIFKSTGNEVFLMACHLKSESIIPISPVQFSFFGAGHAFVKSSCLDGINFEMAYEFGFGEDIDFGMQIRNKGFDILAISTYKILHLKAPIGGFRTKPILRWHNEIIQPKPSPTVMLCRLTHNTKEQLLSYKTTLFFKNINLDFLKNPLTYIKKFNSKWYKSIYWANKLNDD